MLEVISHLHPLLVHLPIGILLFAFVITALPEARREQYGPSLQLSLAIASLTALFSCVTGYLLHQSDAYDETLVSRHQWAGIATTVLTATAWLWRSGQRWMVWMATASLMVTGHLGGSLTHGEGYLLQSFQQDREISDEHTKELPGEPMSDSAKLLAGQYAPYAEDIEPILRTKCYGCHSSKKMKGGLRLDAESFILKGGKEGKILVAGNPAASPLYANLILPLDDDMHMPPKGKQQLTKSEIALIHSWIGMGAPFGKVKREANTDTGNLTANALKTESAAAMEAEEEKIIPPPQNLPLPDPQAVAALREKGAIVQEVMTASNGLYVSLINVAQIDDGIMKHLALLNEQLIELKLAGLPLKDEHMRILPACPNLRRLDLSRTAITDAGLMDMERFGALEVLNVYGCAVSDQLVQNLAPCKAIRKIYAWNTGLSASGIQQLQKLHTGLSVDAGKYGLEKEITRKAE